MKQDGLFLGPGRQRLQFFAPHHEASEIVLDFGGRNAVLDRLDDVLALPGEPR
jgi:hypothetical protein